MTVTGFSPLGNGKSYSKLGFQDVSCLEDPIIMKISHRLNVSTAQELSTKRKIKKKYLFFQVVLRWALERGISLVTKSCNTDRLAQNLDLFSFQLSDQDRKYVEIKKKYYSLISLFYFYPHQTNWRDGPKSEIQWSRVFLSQTI